MLGLNRNVWLLTLAQPFALSVSPAIVFISGIVGKQLAPLPELSTLPISMMILGMTLGAIIAGLLAQALGRQRTFLLAMLVNSIACVVAASGIYLHSFVVFLLGVFIAGMTLAATAQFRFAAAEQVDDPSLTPRALSVLMLANVAAAIVGTELISLGQFWLKAEFAGSFLAVAAAGLIAFTVLLFYRDKTSVVEPDKNDVAEHWTAFLKRPVFIVAVSAAAIGYGVMSFVMTATPLAMHDMMGHSLDETKWVIQSHIMAMFLPSLITGELIRRFGTTAILSAGILAYLGTTAAGLMGVQVMHYWWSLVLLGIGWNFLFVGGTTLLTRAYRPHEKYKAQSINDLCVFVFQAAASLGAGALLFALGWMGVIWVALIPTLVLLVMLSIWWRAIQPNAEVESPIRA